jgi:glutaminyl-tRNA synthetase
MSVESERNANFIQLQIEKDLASGRYGGRVATRFPPEPNGYLHIGHAKSICLNFGLARRYGGTCNLRYDDTNPSTEDAEYVENILRDVRWLGFEPDAVYYASDYYGQLYAWAEQLIHKGLAYVDDAALDELRENRGTVMEAGKATVGRSRSVEENLRLFREMREGLHADGSMVLRARIDLGHANMKLRDPLLYRIRRMHHYRTGDSWCIYPMYDWAHGQSDAIERITHSICTLEFENNRELYDWFLDAIGADAIGTAQVPNQYEFARLNLTYTVVSKRKLLRLVKEGHVKGWDDPRMPTLAGFRRRGVRPEAIRAFTDSVGVARAQSLVDVGLLDYAIRDDLNRTAERRMAVLDPIKVELTNWPADRVDTLTAPSFPPDVGLPGTRQIPFGRELYIDRDDFSANPPKGFKRLVPGGEVRLRYGWVIRCDEVISDEAGKVTTLRCTVDLATLGANPEGRTVKGVIHWVPSSALPAKVRLYDRLFSVPEPDTVDDFLTAVNPRSLVEVDALVEPAAVGEPGVRWQFERHGYFYRAPEDAAEGLVFGRIVGLKDGFEKPVEEAPRAVVDPTLGHSSAEEQARLRAEARQARLDGDPALAAVFARLAPLVGNDDAALRVAESAGLVALFDAAVGAGAPGGPTAQLLLNAVLVETKGALEGLKFDGAAVAVLVARIESGALTAAAGRKVVAALVAGGGDVDAVISKLGLDRVLDEGAVGAIVDAVLAANPKEAARWIGGDDKVGGFLTGKIMRETKGAAAGELVQAILAARRG